MLGSAKITAFVATKNSDKAKAFYVDLLGLRFVSDDRFALVLDANGVRVRIAKITEFVPQPFTVLGWEVEDIERVVSELSRNCAKTEHFGLPGQDERGIWTAPTAGNATGGARVAWFKDPDGNVLSVTQFI